MQPQNLYPILAVRGLIGKVHKQVRATRPTVTRATLLRALRGDSNTELAAYIRDVAASFVATATAA